MAFDDLRQYLEALRARGELWEVDGFLSPRYEVSALIDAAQEAGRGAVMVYPSGDAPPVRIAGNLLPSREAFALCLGVGAEEAIPVFAQRMKEALPPRLSRKAPVAEVKETVIDLGAILPVLTHYAGDSGPFITTGMITAGDPETGGYARGIHRMEVRGANKLGIALINPPLGTLLEKAAERGEKLKVAVSIGLEPLTLFSAALKAPHGVDKLSLAGGLRGTPVEVFKAPYTGFQVPAGSEFLLEGEVDPEECGPDGPLGEISGYSLSFPATPTFNVKAVCHRAQPIYHALNPASREADLMLTLVAEATLDPGLAKIFPCLKGFHFVPGTFGSCLNVKLSKTGPAEVRSLLLRLLSQPMVKKVAAVAMDVDPSDLAEVEWSVATRCQPERDVIIVGDLKGQPIDPSSGEGFKTSKIGFDATGFTLAEDRQKVVHDADARKKALALIKGHL